MDTLMCGDPLQVDRNILDDSMINFCKAEADTHFADNGITVMLSDGTGAPAVDVGGLTGGAFYDRRQNTLFTPANLFWARFNRMRQGGASVPLSPPLSLSPLAPVCLLALPQLLSSTHTGVQRRSATWTAVR